MLAVVLLATALQSPDFEYLYREALAMREKQFGREHPKVADRVLDLALYLKRRGETAEPKRLLRRALGMYEKAKAAQFSIALENLADLSQPAEAETLLRRAVAADPDTPRLAARLADVLERRGKLEEAESLYRRALSIQEKTLDANDPAIAATCNNLGLVVEARGRPGDAGLLFGRAAVIYEKAYGRRHPEYATALANLAGTLRAQGDTQGAVKLLQQAHMTLEATVGPDHSNTRQACAGLAAALAEIGDRGGAEAIRRRCR